MNFTDGRFQSDDQPAFLTLFLFPNKTSVLFRYLTSFHAASGEANCTSQVQGEFHRSSASYK